MKNTRRNDILKIVAMVTMLIDHMGVLYFPEELIFRTIGRIAFPIFCYQLALGYRYTKDKALYRNRLLLFGGIAQTPYIFLNTDMVPGILHFNVILLFAFATYVLEFYDNFINTVKDDFLSSLPSLFALIGLILLPQILEYILPSFYLSYGTYGVLMILAFYIAKQNAIKIVIGFAIVSILGWQLNILHIFINEYINNNNVLTYNEIWIYIKNYKDGLNTLSGFFFQTRSLLALPFIIGLEYLKPKFKMDRRIGYYFYPVHITVLLLIRLALGITF